MKISWIRYKEDSNSFKIFKNLGLDVFDIDDLEKADDKIQELIQREYSTIIMSNEVASFSENIIKKYNLNKDVNIIIAPIKKEKLDE